MFILVAVAARQEGSFNSADTVQNGGTIQPTQAPIPTPTPTPTPSPTPAPPGTGDHMKLGGAYSTDSSKGFYIIDPKDTFSANDQMAFVVSVDQPFNTFHLTFALVRLYSEGGASVVLTAPITLADSHDTQLANQFLTSTLMGSNPPGQYRLEVENDTAVLAQADFTYTG
jgi:hypothetical protein